MAEFDPRQLDQLEDALERIDDIDDIESLELSADLTERLGEYQDVLALCRDAFPIEEPSAALLSEVIAEAHEVTRRSRPTPEPGAWRRFWDRWRGTLIPSAALAGTAAAILFLLEPDKELERAAELIQADEAHDADEAIERAESDDSPSKPASEPAIEAEPEPEPEPSAGKGGEAIEAKPDLIEHQPKKKKKASPAIEPEPEPAPEPLSKDDTWSKLEQANAARRKGKCSQARTLYAAVDDASTDLTAIARAKAGIGLCLEQQQRDGEAKSWFADARATSPGVDSWIDTERDEQPQPGEFDSKSAAADSPQQSKKKSKKSKY